jgi:3-methylcrotonyl-CoA carboxylase alpha subunit
LRIASGGKVRDVRLARESARLDDETLEFRSDDGASGEILEIGGRRYRIVAARGRDRAFVWCDGEIFEFSQAPATARSGATPDDLLAPMPGRIRKTLVTEGQTVSRGDVLLVLEAMKMEHTIRAPRDGSVRRLPHAEGELVETGTPLVELAD